MAAHSTPSNALPHVLPKNKVSGPQQRARIKNEASSRWPEGGLQYVGQLQTQTHSTKHCSLVEFVNISQQFACAQTRNPS